MALFMEQFPSSFFFKIILRSTLEKRTYQAMSYLKEYNNSLNIGLHRKSIGNAEKKKKKINACC